MSPRCHLESANFHEFRKYSGVSKRWESVSTCRFQMSIRRYDIETEKNKILFRSLLLWFIRGERRKYGDSQRKYIGSLLSKWLEIRLGDRQSNAFFLFFSFYKIEIIQKSIIWRLFKRSINHIMIWINLTMFIYFILLKIVLSWNI